ncbi:helix-turn-helix domain-containing protein [Rhodococcus spongiicola]|nr:helix-turn-helix transcriptional regulator [Rhodococcus spongiicola]
METVGPTFGADEVRTAIAGEIRALRGRRGMSQTELRERAGFSRSTMRRIESGERDVEIAELMAISTALGINAAELLQAVQDSLEGKQL